MQDTGNAFQKMLGFSHIRIMPRAYENGVTVMWQSCDCAGGRRRKAAATKTVNTSVGEVFQPFLGCEARQMAIYVMICWYGGKGCVPLPQTEVRLRRAPIFRSWRVAAMVPRDAHDVHAAYSGAILQPCRHRPSKRRRAAQEFVRPAVWPKT